MENYALLLFVKDQAKKDAWHYCQFISCEEELKEVMVQLLEKCTSEWKKMEQLNDDDFDAQIKECTRVYGGYVAMEINEKQNTLASQLKKMHFKWMERHGS